ncbi:nuclear transport factor 2 family protein [Planomonospora sp. ID67723]|uniref:nuclear transport factor 2 family protein n=1 Tax=Planomonospora sp. ID67723 TaxID=2738134 RepID=UPI0018C4432E|nr:nuclear transport factor 2 family protein [Planomonospora sp. ID67723]MBG0830763.1 nuclear transport factor 2 family protein [Planomonospora sp. ID67723]
MTSPALQIALAHHRAWTTDKDLDLAMGYIADDVVCDAPAGRLDGVRAYRDFLAPFAERFLIRAEMIAAFGDDSTAVLMYDAETIPARSAPAAECVTVRDGKIVYNRFVFDRTPFDEFRRRQARAHP